MAMRKSFYDGWTRIQNPAVNPDSHDYEPDECGVWRAYMAKMHAFDRNHHWCTTDEKDSFRRWLVTFFVGFVTGLIATFVTWSSVSLTSLKFKVLYGMIENNHGGGPYVPAFLVYLFTQLFFTSLAFIAARFVPPAAGSGIPEIKCFLNGINLPRVVTLKTLFAKVGGVIFTVAGGLPAGKEGPMVHCGAVLGAELSHGREEICSVDTSFTVRDSFRSDREKRDFVACGAAAGVAAAFGAPIGGVLFSLEEGASFWSTHLTWRAFSCAMITVFTLHFVKNSSIKWGQQSLSRMFSFGEFSANREGGKGSYSVWELGLFLIVGCMGGFIGAAFNSVNELMTRWRMRHITTSTKKLTEVVVITTLMSITAFGAPLLWRQCTPRPVDTEGWSQQDKNLADQLVSFNCNSKTEYNQVASLFFTDADTAIRQLFHFYESGDTNSVTFSSGALLIFFVPYICLACITYGITVPSGLFVPSLLSGAAFGRLFGHLLHKLDRSSGTFADSGTYALIGAAGALGGMARMTISLTVILLEATGDMQYVLPLMLALMSARFVGNIFNEGLYEIHIHLRKLPFLDDELPLFAKKYDMTASQVMSRKIVCLQSIETAGRICDILSETEYNCFPVLEMKGESHSSSSTPDLVTQHGEGVLAGTVLRRALYQLVKLKAFGNRDNDTRPSSHRVSPLISWEELERRCTEEKFHMTNLTVAEGDRNCVVDLRPYVNTAPYVINESSSLARTYRLFRTLGLRHLCVTNIHNQVVGMLTRKDLIAEKLIQALNEPKNRLWSSSIAIENPPAESLGPRILSSFFNSLSFSSDEGIWSKLSF